MKYWSSSRVGAVPQQSQPNHKKDRNVRSQRNKGITMEDLKKQTALRLAHEQNQYRSATNGGSYIPGNSAAFGVVHPPPTGTPQRLNLASPPPTGRALLEHAESTMPRPSNPVPPSTPYYDPYRSQPVDQRSAATPFPSPTPVYLPDPHVDRPSQTPSYEVSLPSQSKSKLPHGLTVQELKEMTKARLQAEASDKNDVPTARFEYREQGPSTPSPSSQVLNSQRARTHSQGRDGWSQDSRADTWETCSVSTAASDFLGSESAYGVGSLAGENPSPFGLTLTGPDARPLDNVAFPSVSSSSGFYMDSSSLHPNRRRAATLSPRQGLSHLDEQRELYDNRDLPSLPSFATPNGKLYHRSRNSYGPDRYPGGLGVIGGVNDPNRPRTSSAASLPAVALTTDEFSVAELASFGGPASGISTLHEVVVPSPSVTGLADGFRATPTPPGFSSPVQAPPGLGSRPRVATSVGFGDGLQGLEGFSDPRGRAATWGGPGSMFGSGLFGSSTTDDALSQDLASILKLPVGDADTNRLYRPPGL